jgi:hypothetical protein
LRKRKSSSSNTSYKRSRHAPDEVKAVKKCATPERIKAFRSFLGMAENWRILLMTIQP